MKKLIFSIALILSCVTTAKAESDWTSTDTALQATYAVLHVMDWSQTRWLSRHPYKYENKTLTYEGKTISYVEARELNEANIFLGKRPSALKVDTYFATTLLLHTAVSYALPPKYRKVWQCVTIGFEGGVVARNASLGVKMKF